MAAHMIDFYTLDQITAGKLGEHDVPCPACGPARRRSTSQRRPVLRVWRFDRGFATFHCARCGERGFARDGSVVFRRPDPAAIARARAEAAERERVTAAERLSKAQWLWSQRKPLAGTIAETYLREARSYSGSSLPATLGYLPSHSDYPPALIAAFGRAREPEYGRLEISRATLRGVHLTRLACDGSGKAGTEADKIMIGRSGGSPIVLAPPNDLLGMAVTEGLEDGSSVYQATGLGVWAAGAALRMPALASLVPRYIEAVTIYAHGDPAGQAGALDLARALHGRGIEVSIEGSTP
jgi:hypothetical protein